MSTSNPQNWCAKLYEHGGYSGWEYLIPETNGVTNIDSSKNNGASSVKVRNGCQFVAYQGYDGQNLLVTLTEDSDTEFVTNHNDKTSSYSCNCGEYKVLIFGSN